METASGAKVGRIELEKTLNRSGRRRCRSLFIKRPVGRSLWYLLEIVAKFNEKKVGLQYWQNAIDAVA
jgi:hypothetical protein